MSSHPTCDDNFCWRNPTLTGKSSKTWDLTAMTSPDMEIPLKPKKHPFEKGKSSSIHPPFVASKSSFFGVQLNMDWHSDINQTFPHDFRESFPGSPSPTRTWRRLMKRPPHHHGWSDVPSASLNSFGDVRTTRGQFFVNLNLVTPLKRTGNTYPWLRDDHDICIIYIT